MLGPLQFTLHQDIPTVDAVHNPAIAFDQHQPNGLRRMHGIRPVDPAVDSVRCCVHRGCLTVLLLCVEARLLRG